MNDNIDRIIKYSSVSHYPIAGMNFDSPDYVVGSDELEEFAQEIVRECINHIMNSSDRYRKDHFANMLFEHFGMSLNV